MWNPLLDIRIGTRVKANPPDPAACVRKPIPLGFESVQPFFRQTLGIADLPRLAGRIAEAMGDAEATVGAPGMFGNPPEDGELDRATLAGREMLIDTLQPGSVAGYSSCMATISVVAWPKRAAMAARV
jgi:hypothetical protein